MGVAHNNFHIFPRSVPAEAICSIGNWDHVNITPHEFISKPLESTQILGSSCCYLRVNFRRCFLKISNRLSGDPSFVDQSSNSQSLSHMVYIKELTAASRKHLTCQRIYCFHLKMKCKLIIEVIRLFLSGSCP